MDAPSSRPERLRSSSRQPNQRPSSSSGSDTSIASNLTSISVPKRPPHGTNQPNMSSYTASNVATASSNHSALLTPSRPPAQHAPHSDHSSRRASPLGGPPSYFKHQRQHSQGYFDTSMPSTSTADNSSMAGLSASQIAAQAAMQHLSLASHARKRSQTVPAPPENSSQEGRKIGVNSPPPPLPASGSDLTTNQALPMQQQYKNGLVGNMAAATAANVAFPRNLMSTDNGDKEQQKKSSKRRIFRPKHIGISRDKDKEGKDREAREKPPRMSPSKLGSSSSALSRVVNASTTSVADSTSSGSTLYSLNNASASTTTIVPIPSTERPASHEKEKSHKHGGLRQKLKLKDKDDHHLPLSSANSNSRPLNSENPTSLYSFEPSSPGPNSNLNFSKSVSGLDLRHAGRALREKKREAKALVSGSSFEGGKHKGEHDGFDWPPGNHSIGTLSTSFPQSSMLGPLGAMTPGPVEPALKEILSTFGLQNMTSDDAWDFLKAKILVIFEGEDVRVAVEDLNKLVTIHVQRCVQRNQPSTIIDDLDDLFRTGFLSLNHSIRSVPDDRLVPHLVSIWITVFQKVLPFMQAVFFPLDQEFKGRGVVLTSLATAADFWGVLPGSGPSPMSSAETDTAQESSVSAGNELESRRMLLISFRDTVILSRYDSLKAIFSRLSLDSINAHMSSSVNMSESSTSSFSDRPYSNLQSQSQSQFQQGLDPTLSSFNSQSSTLLGATSSNTSTNRSRATSSTSTSNSNPAQDIAFQSLALSPPTARPSDTPVAHVTNTVGRMLQCLCVLASVQSGDDAQAKMEDLAKELKLNWLGRARTGRNRRGFVGTRTGGALPSATRSSGSTSTSTTTTGTVGTAGSATGQSFDISGRPPAGFCGKHQNTESNPTTPRAVADGADDRGGIRGMPGAFGSGFGRSML